MSLPCRGYRMPLHLFNLLHLPLLFWTASYVEVGVVVAVPLNTSRPRRLARSSSQHLPSSIKTLHTDSACVWQAEGRERGRTVGFMSVLIGWVWACSWLCWLDRSALTAQLERRKEGGEEEKGWDEINHVGGVNPVWMKRLWEEERWVWDWDGGGRRTVERQDFASLCSTNVAVSVSGFCWQRRVIKSHYWGSWQPCTMMPIIQMCMSCCKTCRQMTNARGKVALYTILCVFVWVDERVSVKPWMTLHVWEEGLHIFV